MSLDDIAVFVEVVDAGSFTKAAKRLGIPLSTASAKVARLEETLGATLLQRTTRQVQVTETGQLYYAHCLRALDALTEAEQLINSTTDEPRGQLRITTPVDVAQFVMADVVDSFVTAYPEVSVELVVTNRKVDLIAEGVDLAVRVGPLEDSNLIARKFISSQIGLFASPEYLDRKGTPTTASDLKDHTMVRMMLDRGRNRYLDMFFGQLNLAETARVTADDISTIRAFIEAGIGIGLVPSFASSGLVQVLPQLTTEPSIAYLVYPEQRFVPSKIRAFINHATSHLDTSANQ